MSKRKSSSKVAKTTAAKQVCFKQDLVKDTRLSRSPTKKVKRTEIIKKKECRSLSQDKQKGR